MLEPHEYPCHRPRAMSNVGNGLGVEIHVHIPREVVVDTYLTHGEGIRFNYHPDQALEFALELLKAIVEARESTHAN
jgi:hypothetical protein